MRSTTAVSKTTMWVFTARSEASTAPNTPAYTTEAAIEPLWSTQSTISLSACPRRPSPTSFSGITLR